LTLEAKFEDESCSLVIHMLPEFLVDELDPGDFRGNEGSRVLLLEREEKRRKWSNKKTNGRNFTQIFDHLRRPA